MRMAIIAALVVCLLSIGIGIGASLKQRQMEQFLEDELDKMDQEENSPARVEKRVASNEPHWYEPEEWDRLHMGRYAR